MISKIGGYMAVFGVLAIVLGVFNIVPRILGWIYIWGNAVAWLIKISFVVVGCILYFRGQSTRNDNSI
jgi:hypothetical protein